MTSWKILYLAVFLLLLTCPVSFNIHIHNLRNQYGGSNVNTITKSCTTHPNMLYPTTLLKHHYPSSTRQVHRVDPRSIQASLGCSDFALNPLRRTFRSPDLVGGFNPPWKIWVKLDHLPRDRGENKKSLKPPARGWVFLRGFLIKQWHGSSHF